MKIRAALGFKVHTGWAMLVAVAGQPDKIELLLRRRIELLPSDGSVPRFVYHQAAELPLAKAAALVEHAEKAAQNSAELAIKTVLEEIEPQGARVAAGGVLSGSTAVPDDLSKILGSHPLIHAAEGALFLQAIVSACEARRISVSSTPEREVWSRAATAWGVSEASLRKKMDELRKSVGSPWSADHKVAAAGAMLALKG